MGRIFAPILGNQGPKVAEIQKKLQQAEPHFSLPVLKYIFEQVIRLQPSPSAFVKSLEMILGPFTLKKME